MRSSHLRALLLCLLLTTVATFALTQERTGEVSTPDSPAANPGRPTVSAPAKLTPVGYLQFETGVLGAWHSPGVVSQTSLNEVIKYSVSRWIEFLASTQPYAHSHAPDQPTNAPGDVDLGLQVVAHHGMGANPTIALGYLGRVYAGAAPNLDIPDLKNTATLLISAKVKGFHYDTNYIFGETMDADVRRAVFGQTLSLSHRLPGKFGLSGEIWHFTQPFLRGNAVGNLWALDYVAKKNLVLDCGFDHGLTSTSAQWEAFAGFTYLLPHKLPLHW